MAVVAQMVRAEDCGSSGRGFEFPPSPQFMKMLGQNRALGSTVNKRLRPATGRVVVPQAIPTRVGVAELCGYSIPPSSPKTSWPSGQATDCNSVNVSSTLTEVSMMARSQAAKAPGFGPGIRGFESSRAIQPFVGV